MIICERCFCDTEVISVIRYKAGIGDCPLCKSKSVHIYDTDKYEDLSMMFDELISIYTPTSLLPASYPKSETRLLKSELITNWNIFNKKNEAEVYNIITAICKEKYEYNAELFDQPVGIRELYDQEYLSKHSLLTTNSWDDFVKALKTKNRFHTHYVNLGLLERFCSYIRKPYKTGDMFYRCRISTEEGIPLEEMGKIMRRSDSALDYVPTQYITDFVKSITHDDVAEYAGIEYKSVMHNAGYNLALFDPDLFECIDTEVYRIDTIDYRKHLIM